MRCGWCRRDGAGARKGVGVWRMRADRVVQCGADAAVVAHRPASPHEERPHMVCPAVQLNRFRFRLHSEMVTR